MDESEEFDRVVQLTATIERQLLQTCRGRLVEQHLVWGELHTLVTVALKFLEPAQLVTGRNLRISEQSNKKLSVLVYCGATTAPDRVGIVEYEYSDKGMSYFRVLRLTGETLVEYRITHLDKGPDTYEQIGEDGPRQLEGRNYEEKIAQIIAGLVATVTELTGLKPRT